MKARIWIYADGKNKVFTLGHGMMQYMALDLAESLMGMLEDVEYCDIVDGCDDGTRWCWKYTDEARLR